MRVHHLGVQKRTKLEKRVFFVIVKNFGKGMMDK